MRIHSAEIHLPYHSERQREICSKDRPRQSFSIRISIPRLSRFTNAGGEGVRPGSGRTRLGDMRVRPPIYAFGGILSAHISFGITGNCRYIRSDQRYAVILSGCVYGHKRQASFRTGRLTASNPDLYLIKKIDCCKISLFEVFSRFRYRSVRDNKVKSTYFFD